MTRVPSLTRHRNLTLTVAAAAAIALIVVAAVVVNAVVQAQKLEQYTHILRSYPGADFETISNKQFATNFNSRCSSFDVLNSQTAVIAAAERNWVAVQSSSNVSEQVWVANNLAFYAAARATC